MFKNFIIAVAAGLIVLLIANKTGITLSKKCNCASCSGESSTFSGAW